MADKYDEEIAALTAEARRTNWQEAIHRAWLMPNLGVPGGALFQFCTPSGSAGEDPAHGSSGCLTMVRLGGHVAWTEALTTEIAAGGRLPKQVGDILPGHLPVLAEWQRRLDTEIRGGGEVTPDAVVVGA